MGVQYLFESLLPVLLDVYLEVELLDQIVILCLIFWETSIPFSMAAAPWFINSFFVECLTDCREKVCTPGKYDRKWSEVRVNSLLNDSAPWLLKQVNLLETLPLVCPHTTVCTCTNKCMAGSKSSENHWGNELRIYGSGPFENVDRLPCNPTVKRNLERLAGGLKGQSHTGGPQMWMKSNWASNTLSRAVWVQIVTLLFLYSTSSSPLQCKHLVTMGVLVE